MSEQLPKRDINETLKALRANAQREVEEAKHHGMTVDEYRRMRRREGAAFARRMAARQARALARVYGR